MHGIELRSAELMGRNFRLFVRGLRRLRSFGCRARNGPLLRASPQLHFEEEESRKSDAQNTALTRQASDTTGTGLNVPVAFRDDD